MRNLLVLLFCLIYSYANAQVLTKNISTTLNSRSLRSGLVLYLPCVEGSGSTCRDYSGHSETLSITGATWVAGPPKTGGNALSFTGSSSSYSTTPTFPLIGGSGTKTIILWAQVQSTPNTYSLLNSLSSSTTCGDYGLGFTGGNLYFSGYNCDHTIISQSGIVNGNWHSIIYSYNGNTVNTIIDCKLINVSQAFLKTSFTNSYTIGNAVPSQPFGVQAYIAQFTVWNRLLSQAEISAVCNGTHP